MSNPIQSAATLCGYLLKPSHYPFLLRLARSPFTGEPRSLDQTQSQAEAWSRQRLVPPEEILSAITDDAKFDNRPIREQFVDVFEGAEKRVRDSGFEMGGPGHLDLIYQITQATEAIRIIETGVAYGWSSLAILLSLRNRPGQLVSTNLHYRDADDESIVGCAVPEDLRSQWTIVMKKDSEALPEAIEKIGGPLDFVHYDSDKTYGGRMFAYKLLWENLKVGGVLVSDDICDNLAFAHFTKMARTPAMVADAPAKKGRKYIGVMIKRDDRPMKDIFF